MPKATPFVKVQQTRAHGAEVVIDGDGYDEASATPRKLRRPGLTFVHPFNDVPTSWPARARSPWRCWRTCRILRSCPIPIGGGGLIAGMATAAKHMKPEIRIIGVEPAMYPSFTAKMRGVNGARAPRRRHHRRRHRGQGRGRDCPTPSCGRCWTRCC